LSLYLALWDLPRHGISLMVWFDLKAGATAPTFVVGAFGTAAAEDTCPVKAQSGPPKCLQRVCQCLPSVG